MRKSLFWTLDHPPSDERALPDRYEATHQHAELADQLGFQCLWLGEHHASRIGSIPNPAILLASLARVTKTIRLGPAVAVLPLRNPKIIYEDYVMMDHLSRGRLNLGLGCGSRPEEFQYLGVDYNSRRFRFDQGMKEIQSIKENLSLNKPQPGELNFHQSPLPPIYIATTDPDRAYEAGQSGLSVLTLVSPLAEDLTILQRILEAHGRGKTHSTVSSDDSEVVVTILAHAADSETDAIGTARASVGRFLEVLKGEPTRDGEDIARTMVDRNTGLFGSTRQIVAQLRELHDLGVRHVSFLVNFGGVSVEETDRSIRLLSRAVVEVGS